ncbi:MAG: hypothetical protein ABIW76_17485 [Fibrobacteria bacterium]
MSSEDAGMPKSDSVEQLYLNLITPRYPLKEFAQAVKSQNGASSGSPFNI